MTETAPYITIRDSEAQIILLFDGYDGDDCFEKHSIEVTKARESKTFYFGGCAISGLRRYIDFFRKNGNSLVGCGFQHEGIIKEHDCVRREAGYKFSITFDQQEVESVFLADPSVEIEPGQFRKRLGLN